LYFLRKFEEFVEKKKICSEYNEQIMVKYGLKMPKYAKMCIYFQNMQKYGLTYGGSFCLKFHET